ncbi:MAG: hypothetical protein Q8T08_11425, partial [Ignavibacteria bacterium]|nr:hypothetical protein [Ignavibacteria bacterium]
MTRLRFMTCAYLIGIIIGLTDLLKADNAAKAADENRVYQELLATKNISQLEVSPDKKHLLLVYSQPQVSSSGEDTTSQWVPITFVKNDYQSEKSHTVTFPQDVSIISPLWSPDSQWVSYLGKGDKFFSLWVTPPQEFKPRKILELENDIMFYVWSPNSKKLAVLVNESSAQDPLKRVYDENEGALQTLYVIDINDQLKEVSKTALMSGPSLFGGNATLVWTPDSEAIICGYTPPTKDKNVSIPQIALINVKTKDIKTLVEGEEMNLTVQVSPDGKWVSYVTTNFPENSQSPIPLYGMAASRACLV